MAVLKTPEDFYTNCKTVTIASLMDGAPWCSYAPFVCDDDNRLYVLISEMAAHTRNLLKDSRASVFLIEDESLSDQIFARRRLTLNAQAEDVPKDGAGEIIAKFGERFGDAYNNLHELGDFHLIRFTPVDGSLVLGFGMAYRITYSGGEFEVSSRRGGGHKPAK